MNAGPRRCQRHPLLNRDIEEHDAPHHQYYIWLRKARQNKIEHETKKLCDQARKRTVDSVLNSLMKVKIPQDSVHGKVEVLVNAISVAK